MAYITKKQVKEKREELKELFSRKLGWKFSVKNERLMGISVSIIEAPFKMNIGSINGNRINEDYENRPKLAKILNKMYEIINNGNHNNSDIMTDYFNVGFYVDMRVGRYSAKTNECEFKWNRKKS